MLTEDSDRCPRPLGSSPDEAERAFPRRSVSGGEGMSTRQYQTASGRPLRVSPAWVGAAGHRAAGGHLLPVQEAVWIWSVRRYARVSLWGLPVGAALYGWVTLGVAEPPGLLLLTLGAGWFCVVALIGLAGL